MHQPTDLSDALLLDLDDCASIADASGIAASQDIYLWLSWLPVCRLYSSWFLRNSLPQSLAVHYNQETSFDGEHRIYSTPPEFGQKDRS